MGKITKDEYFIIATAKRFFELIQGDLQFIDKINAKENLDKLVKLNKLSIPSNEVKNLISLYCKKKGDKNVKQSKWINTWLTYQKLMQESVDRIRLYKNNIGFSSEYFNWRKIQINRSNSELGNQSTALIHGLAAIELTEGCSGQCSYCGLGSKKLKNIFHYSPENKLLWKKVLSILKTIFGEFSANSVCYWATDPYDNPDYFNIISDFREVLGVLPQTTTSLPTEDINWLKKLLKLYENSGTNCRVSINTPGLLKKIHNSFSPEELFRVILLINYSDKFPVVRSGRYLSKQKIEKGNLVEGTIACITGFIINMCKKTIKLVSPCTASKKWPFGYIVHYETEFVTAKDFEIIINDTVNNHMKTTFRENDLVSLREDLELEINDNTVLIKSKACKHYFTGSHLPKIAKKLNNGPVAFSDLVFDLLNNGGEYIGVVENIRQLKLSGLFSEQVELLY